jgi:inorganic triphosphatase YgiF
MGRRGIELEAKFAPVDEATLASLAARTDFPGWRIAGRRDEAQQNTYYDTADSLLEARSCSLRRRLLDRGRGGVEWTFKRGRGPGRDGIARRREVNALLPPNQTDLGRASCEPVARARRVVGDRPLLPLFTLLTTRTQIELARADGTRVALALDRLRMEGEPGYRETEVEIELLDGDERGLAELAVWLMRQYGVLPMRGSKRGRAITWKRGEGLPVVTPDLALDLLAERTLRLLVLQTLTMPSDRELRPPRNLPFDQRDRLLHPAWPKLAFFEHRFAGDPTNWWAPNDACVEAMLRSAGLDVIERPGYQLWVCRPLGLPEQVLVELDAATGRR